MDLLKKINNSLFNKIVISFVVVFIIFLTAPTLFSDNHFLYNLEPYPDGLYYTLSAKNFIENGKLTLQYNDIDVYISQPPLYSLILTIGYLFWNNPASFYLINITLLIGTIIIITKIVLNKKVSKTLKILSILFFITHGYLYLLASLPMTENLTLFIFSIGIYILSQKKFNRADYIKICIVSIALILTRLSVVPTAITFLLIGFYKLYPQLSKKEKTYYLLLLIISFIIANFGFKVLLDKSLVDYFIYFFKESFLSNEQSLFVFYNNSYLIENVRSYIKALLGQNANFLWFNYPLTSIALIIGIIANLFTNTKKKLLKIFPMIIIFLSIFSLLITFYLSDSRYIIYVIPLLIVSFSTTIPSKINRKQQIFYIVLILIHFFNQAPIFKQLIADNILHRSTAWQYEAIIEIETFAKNKNISIITALPPHLVDAYSSNSMKILPLSTHQEFLQKKQYVWGSNIDYDNLPNYYRQLVQNGEEIYITNAYVNHQQSVIVDYEAFKNSFELILEHEGCLNTCNIYKLQQKR